LPAAILLVMYIGSRPSALPEKLQRHSAIPVAFAQDRQELIAGTVVVAPPEGGQHPVPQWLRTENLIVAGGCGINELQQLAADAAAQLRSLWAET
jgi:hypothetical protein